MPQYNDRGILGIAGSIRIPRSLYRERQVTLRRGIYRGLTLYGNLAKSPKSIVKRQSPIATQYLRLYDSIISKISVEGVVRGVDSRLGNRQRLYRTLLASQTLYYLGIQATSLKERPFRYYANIRRSSEVLNTYQPIERSITREIVIYRPLL